MDLKKSEKAHRYNLAKKTSIIVKKVVIIDKQKTKDCKKLSNKALDTFFIKTLLDSINNIIFLYK